MRIDGVIRTARPRREFLLGCIVLVFGLVSLGLHCFLWLSCARLTVALGPRCCWACSTVSV